MTKETLFNAAAGFAVATLSFASLWAAGQPIAAEESGAPSVASPSASAPATPAAKGAPAKTITVDELKAMLVRKETPRVTVVNKFGGRATGKALRIEGADLRIDTSAEGVGVEGLLGIPLSSIVSITPLAPVDDKQAQAASSATRDYLRRVSLPAAATVSTESVLPASSTDSALVPAVASTQSAVSVQTAQPALEAQVDYLAIYPLKEGWGPRKLGEIRRKAVVLGQAPLGKEKTFLTDYEAWRKAYETRRNMQLEEQAAMQGMGKTPPAGFEVWPELEETPPFLGAPDAPVGNNADAKPAGQASEPVGQSAPDEPTGDIKALEKK